MMLAERAETGMELRPEWVLNPPKFWSKVAIASNDDCWPWVAKNRFKCGYGKFYIKRPDKGCEAASHRIAYALSNSCTIPSGAHVLHSCDNRLCCNPSHLRLGTRSDNIQDAWDRERRSRVKNRSSASRFAKPIFAEGKLYGSAVEAAMALNKNYHTVAARARNHWFGYYYA